MTLHEAGRYVLSTDFARFLGYTGARTLTVSSDPHLRWHYDSYDNPRGATFHVLNFNRDLLNVSPGHVLELHHGLQHVLGFSRLTAGSKILRLDDGELPLFYPEPEGPYSIKVTYTDDDDYGRAMSFSLPDRYYLTKRDLWSKVKEHLNVWPSLADGPAVRYRNDSTGYEVDLDYLGEDILVKWWLARKIAWQQDDRYFPMDAVAVVRYLTGALSRLPHDPSELQLSWGSFVDTTGEGAVYLMLSVRGRCSVRFSPAMQWFLDRAGDSSTLMTDGDGWHVWRWPYDTHRYKPKAPCNVVPLYRKDEYLLQGWYGTCDFSSTVKQILTFLPDRIDRDQNHIVMAPDLDDLIHQPRLLSTVDLPECHVELDIVEPGWCGDRYRQVIATLALDEDKYEHTVGLDLPHSQYVPLVAPLRDTTEVRAYLRTSDSITVPFYTGIVLLKLHFKKTGQI